MFCPAMDPWSVYGGKEEEDGTEGEDSKDAESRTDESSSL